MKLVSVFVNTGPSDGGTFQYNQVVVDVIKSLPTDVYSCTIFYTNDFWGAYLEDYQIKLVKVNYNPRFRKVLKFITYFNFPLFIRVIILKIIANDIVSIFKKNPSDLIIFPSQDTLSLFLEVPKLNVIHDLMHIYESRFPEVSKYGRKWYRNILFGSFCKESKAIIVDSNVGIEHVHESYHLDRNKIYSWPFIPPPHILEEIPLPADFDEKFKLPKHYLFYPAQFWGHKNHINLIRAAKILKNKGVVINLVFAAKKNYDYPSIEVLIKELDMEEQIFVLGFVPNEYFKEVYLRSRGLIMPTFFGPTNIPPLEAIFLNVPVAVSDIYGMREQLGDASLYFDPLNVENISETMEKLYFNVEIRNELIEKCSEYKQKWNKKKCISQFKEILNKILE